MWFIYALLSAFLASFRKVNDKELSHSVDHMHLAWMNKVAALPVLGVLAAYGHQLAPPCRLSGAFWVSMIVCTCITAPLDTSVYLKSLKHGQLSKTAPLMSLWPAVMLVVGVLFLGQIPSANAVFAILAIVAGVYTLHSRSGSHILSELWCDHGTRFGLIGVLTVSVNTSLGAVAIKHSSPLFVAFWGTIVALPVQFVYAQLVARGKYKGAPIKMIAQNGVLQGLANAMYFSAVAIGPIGYVSGTRSLSSVFAAFHGARKFKEDLDRRKLTGLALISVGIVVLATQA